MTLERNSREESEHAHSIISLYIYKLATLCSITNRSMGFWGFVDDGGLIGHWDGKDWETGF